MSSIHAPEQRVAVLPGVSSKTRFRNWDLVKGYVPGFLMLGCVILFALLALNQQNPPEAVAVSAPPDQFSSARAFSHVEVIGRAPHEIGSAEHRVVRDYIMSQLTALGLVPQIQKTTAFTTRRSLAEAGTVENVVARLSGTNSSRALLLVSHYDSVPTGPGASDNGAGVASLLETLRALKSQPPLKNDVIFLFTDGEEVGLLGASAFINEHPWAKDVGLVLNFEARGNSGPSIMFETSNQNGWLIGELAKAAPYPVGNSLSYDIYRLLPNDTDFTALRDSKLPGMNFAFIEGLTRYHTQLDSVSNVDQRSLQHHGSNALALTRHFGDMNLAQIRKQNAVYFNIPGSILIHYSSFWIIPLTVFVAAVFVAVIVYGLRKKQLSIGGMAMGFLACLSNIVLVAAVIFGIWFLISITTVAYSRMVFGDTYNSTLYLVGFSALTITLVATVYMLWRRKIRAENLWVGGLLWFLIMLVLSALYIPGGSYLFTWPLLFGLFGLAATFVLRTRAAGNDENLPLKLAIVFSISAIPGVLLLVPLIGQIFTALTVQVVFIPMIFVVLLLWSMVPLLDHLTARRRWLLSLVMLAVSLVFIGIGGLSAGFDKNHPQPYHMVYGFDADSGKAVWASAAGNPGKWASQFFASGAERAPLDRYFYKNPRQFLISQAPVTPLPAPEVTLVSDKKMENGTRALRLHITAPEQNTSVFINVSGTAKTTQASVNGKEVKTVGPNPTSEMGTDWGMRYYAPHDPGIDLDLVLESAAAVKVRLIGLSHGLPNIPNTPASNRPEYVIPAPFLLSDSTMVSKTFSFN